MPNHYETLSIPRDASADSIKAAFRRAASLHHPDRGGDLSKMQAANEAYQVLMDREARARYDATLAGVAPGLILTVSRKDMDDAARDVGALAPWTEVRPCAFCEGAKEVRVGAGGFWVREKCPVCTGGSS